VSGERKETWWAGMCAPKPPSSERKQFERTKAIGEKEKRSATSKATKYAMSKKKKMTILHCKEAKKKNPLPRGGEVTKSKTDGQGSGVQAIQPSVVAVERVSKCSRTRNNQSGFFKRPRRLKKNRQSDSTNRIPKRGNQQQKKIIWRPKGSQKTK
jgi:hypothetical protein